MNFRRSIIITELSRPEIADVEKNSIFLLFLEKRLFTGKFSKFCSERIHRDTDRRFVFNFRKIWPTGNR